MATQESAARHLTDEEAGDPRNWPDLEAMESAPAFTPPASPPPPPRDGDADEAPEEELDPAFVAYLEEEGLADERPEDTLELDVWIGKRLAAIAGLHDRIAHENAVAAEMIEPYKRRIQIIENHRDGEVVSLQRQIGYLEQLLIQTALAYPYPKKGGKETRTRKLPFGEIGIRKNPERLEVKDAAAAIAFAKAHEGLAEAVVVKESIPQKELAAYYSGTGEVPDGCEVVPEVDKPFVKAKGGAL